MTAPGVNKDLLENLFPPPSFASAFKISSVPTPNAVITLESTTTLQRLLKDNHQRHHVFFNKIWFHNHLAHHLFSAYTIGALQAAFDEHAWYQPPAYKSPERITHEIWKKFLGEEDYYNSYMIFFANEVQEHGVASTLKRYVFSHEANWSNDKPRAAEFGVPGMAVEGIFGVHKYRTGGLSLLTGLALCAIHDTTQKELFDAQFFGSSTTTGYLVSIASALSFNSVSPKPKTHTHAFTILARILNDSRLEAGQALETCG
ncbi:hypothetical protein RhiLY_12851 [Ceratobasidium sp. AG-Ba]|nr:hypothetical protein RhiLY_12851 [Ceratobasidium sp. AG-Ba]